MGKPKRSARARSRARSRGTEKLARARTRLFLLEAGGSPERPLDVESASLVEPRATAVQCPSCAGAVALEAHDAVTVSERRLRRAAVRCRRCGTLTTLYFRLLPATLN